MPRREEKRMLSGKQKHLGAFDDEQEAARTYRASMERSTIRRVTPMRWQPLWRS